MSKYIAGLLTSIACLAGLPAFAETGSEQEIDRGRYLIKVGGCNDCHTPGFMQTPGEVDESLWLTGVPLGWKGPWGVTYASNLRLLCSEISEDAWVLLCATRKARPPMPWFSLNALTEADARAMYRYIRHLGVAGDRMPLATPPDVTPTGPYLDLMPQEASGGQSVTELRRETPAP